MELLDADRFEGRFREGVHKADVSDIMRQLTKKEVYRFQGAHSTECKNYLRHCGSGNTLGETALGAGRGIPVMVRPAVAEQVIKAV